LLLALIAKNAKINASQVYANLLNSVGFKDARSHLQVLSPNIQNDAIAQLSHSTKMDTAAAGV